MQLQSLRSINIENPQTQPKKASVAFSVGMWLQFDVSGSTGFLKPLVGNTTLGTANGSAGTVEGLGLTPVPSTDATNALITYDGIDDTVDRFTMPVVPTEVLVYNTLAGDFTEGETITGGTSGATAVVNTDNETTTMVISNVVGTFVVGETITGGSSGSTAVVSSVVTNTLPNAVCYLGAKFNCGPDSISLDATVAGVQFQVTKIESSPAYPGVPVVEVRVLKDNN